MTKHLPTYAELAARLRERIEKESLPPGSWIGTEVAIASESGLSRMTVRRAVQSLEEHEEIFRALEARDPEAAAHAATEHAFRARERIANIDKVEN